eukprot:TRINITY_DN7473_c0_g1_i1.p2 TRINITY_DN7473_c0_g1~~TRINITY_DN7473_c0_g1_i1.p2  ORF type:complete len:220 (-),score=44.65 TRINITY_DN7473_c0_g1_i1:186-845(-)
MVTKGEKERLTKLQIYREYLLPAFPPIFYRWFLSMFPQPTAWFQARNGYAKTTAVWSMVGHVVGLGDRHGENILLCSNTGDCLHVDFSCLFEKGKTLDVPECVPFRLTPNMRDALGISGVEGIYRKGCETTMTVLRNSKDTLMGVLETFIHDPLLEWNKSSRSEPVGPKIMRKIERKLCGFVDEELTHLSTEGQVQKLISQATSQENLSKMYLWWMPWL